MVLTATSVDGTCSAASMRSMQARPSRMAEADLVGETSGLCSVMPFSMMSLRSDSPGLIAQPASASTQGHNKPWRKKEICMVYSFVIGSRRSPLSRPQRPSQQHHAGAARYLQMLMTEPRTTVTWSLLPAP